MSTEQHALREYGLFIDGQEVPAERSMTSLNPFNGQAWATVPDGTDQDVDRAVAAARRAFESGPWATMTAQQRGALMRRLADIIKRDAEELARIESTDNGKLYREMLGQWQYMPEYYYYFGGLADMNRPGFRGGSFT